MTNEVEKEIACDSCGSQARILYDKESMELEYCPFCGELLEDSSDLLDLDYDEDEDDDEEDDDSRWR